MPVPRLYLPRRLTVGAAVPLDDSAFSLIMGAFSAFVGNPSTCGVTVDAHSSLPNDVDLFEVYTADIRGDILPGPDDIAEITVTANGRTTSGTWYAVDDGARRC